MRFLSWNLFKGFVKWKIKPNISSNKFTKCYMTYSHLKCHKSCPFLLKTHEGFTLISWKIEFLWHLVIFRYMYLVKAKFLYMDTKRQIWYIHLHSQIQKKLYFALIKYSIHIPSMHWKLCPPSFICPVCSYRWLHLLNWMTGVKLQFFFD